MDNPDIQRALIGVGIAFLGLIMEMLRRQANKINATNMGITQVHEANAVVREHVVNSHETNLRHDLDKVIHGLDKVLLGQDGHALALEHHGREIAAARNELSHEREERMAVAARLDKVILNLSPEDRRGKRDLIL